MDAENAATHTPALAGTKRKRTTEPKIYVVRKGRSPGHFATWAECLAQITGFKGAEFKSFTTQAEANDYLKNGSVARKAANAPPKYYGVQVGRTPGVYTEWSLAAEQVTGWKKPRYKAFPTKAEAEAFVREGAEEGDGSSQGVTEKNSPAPNGIKSQTSKSKKKKIAQDDISLHGDDVEYEAGEGPLPADTEDEFDPRIRLDPNSGHVEYKNDKQMNATVWQANGTVNEGMLHIYTDGSSLGNGGVGAVAGVGVYFGPGDKRNISEGLAGPRQTNQRAELTAILRALELSPRDRPVTIYSDSNYAINCVTTWFQRWRSNGWLNAAKKPIENKDLIEKILAFLEERETISRKYASQQNGDGSKQQGRSRVIFQWIKGHATDPGNIAADGLAVAGANEAKSAAALG